MKNLFKRVFCDWGFHWYRTYDIIDEPEYRHNSYLYTKRKQCRVCPQKCDIVVFW